MIRVNVLLIKLQIAINVTLVALIAFKIILILNA